MSAVQVPSHAAALLAISTALQDHRCENPDVLIGSGFLVIREANSAPLTLREQAFLLDAAADFLRAADSHHPEQRMDAAADLLEQLRDDVLSGASLPVPGSPERPS
jgi:hypothetical protein